MDVGGPSTLKKTHKSVKTKANNEELIGKSTMFTKEPKHTLRSRLRVESDISSSENSETELSSVGAGNKTPPSEVQHAQPVLTSAQSPLWHALPVIRTSL
jgi:hypothetical protein